MVPENTITNVCLGVRIFDGADNDIISNKIQSLRNDCANLVGVLMQGGKGTSVHDNDVVVSSNSIGILVADGNELGTGNFVTGNTAHGTEADLKDVHPHCDSNTWRDNVFATDAGAETDGPGVGCIQ